VDPVVAAVGPASTGASGARPGAQATLTHTDPTRTLNYVVKEPLRLVRNAPLDEYRFTSQLTGKPVKVTVIDTDRIRSVVDLEGSSDTYSDEASLLADVVRIQHEIVRGLVDAGCPYVQIDAPSYTRFVDPDWSAQLRATGRDPMDVFAESLHADNAVVQGIEGVELGIHLCRGTPVDGGYHRQGFYDELAEPLFNQLAHSRYLLDYDTERCGSFAPLRFVPKGKIVVLGLVSTKVPEIESVDLLRRRIDEAPATCRSSSWPSTMTWTRPRATPFDWPLTPGVGGYRLSHDEQRRKFEVLLETARQVWG
jgi:5-methyltetrahydropteroyltriglutamate--homocysteine methyltransferase